MQVMHSILSYRMISSRVNKEGALGGDEVAATVLLWITQASEMLGFSQYIW